MTEKETAEKQSNKEPKILLKERFEIDFNAPLSKFNTNNSTAYKATDISDKKKPMFALISNAKTPPRLSVLPAMRSIKHSSIIKLVDYGIVFDKTQNKECFALIYKEPQGPKILDVPAERIKSLIKDKQKFIEVLQTLFSALETLNGHKIAHRAIRPDNLYFANDNLDSIVLGDCLSCFPGYAQPCAYEPIEMAIADPIAKGDGSSKDDFYSLGASLLALISKKELCTNTSPETIIASKANSSSYYYLSSSIEVPSYLESIIKGLLNDDASQRWQYVELTNSINDKEYLNKKSDYRKPNKPLTIDGIKYNNCTAVALYLSKNQTQALDIINSKVFFEWIKKTSQVDERKKELVSLLEENALHNITPEILIAKTCILLAPSLPIIYKSLSCFPQGLPKSIYYSSLYLQSKVAELKDLIESDIINFWYSKQEDLRPPASLSEYKNYLNNNAFGFGLPRIAYDYDDDIPCYSPLVGMFFVNTLGGVLRALEKNSDNIDYLYDSNIIAYFRCKLGQRFDPIIKEINSHDDKQKRLSILKFYVDIQNKFGPKKLTKILEKMIEFCQPLIEAYHNKKIQQEIKNKVKKVATTGLLLNLYDIIENKKSIDYDNDNYHKAKSLAISLRAEKKIITNSQSQSLESIKKVGIKLVTIFSILIAVIMLIASMLLHI